MWNWNPDPAKTVLIDLETQSACSLKAMGSKRYLRDPTTRLLSLVALVDGVIVVWVPPGRTPAGKGFLPHELWPDGFGAAPDMMFGTDTEPPSLLREAIARGYTFAAHNAMGFDAEAYRLLVGGAQPAAWYDTLPCAKAAGLPGGLDELGKRFAGRGKDETGAKALQLLYTAKVKRGEVVYPVGTRQLWQLMLRYNVADVLLLERVFDEVERYGESDVLDVHCTINARGVAMDRGYLDALANLWAEAGNAAFGRVVELTGGRLHEGNIRSGPAVHKWLKSQGLHLDSLNRQQLQQLYDEPDEFFTGEHSELDVEEFVTASEVNGYAAHEMKTARESTARINEVVAAALAKFGKPRAEDDYARLIGFDTFARELAGEYPDVLGAHGYDADTGYNADEADASARLWDLMCGGRVRVDRRGIADNVRGRIVEGRRRPAPEMDRIERVIEVLKLRQLATRGSVGKINRAYELLDDDGRLRDWATYYGAHTGRWSGRGFQPHNLPRGVKIDIEACLDAFDAGTLTLDTVRKAAPGVAIDDALASLLRPAVVAAPGHRLLICDYAAIEARGIAWVAGEEVLLNLFRRGDDPYCAMASVIFGREITKKDAAERQIGKVVVLGCGYGMSARKFAAYCELQRIDLLAAGVTGDSCVKAYRHTNSNIVAVWKAYNSAAFDAVAHDVVRSAGRCVFGMRGGSLCIRLPSGRELVYRDARIEDRVPGYCKALGIPETPRPTVCYTKPHGYEGNLYGGLLAENIVQATCRDLLATSLVLCERNNLPVVLHVHDEIVCEVPELPTTVCNWALEDLAEIMTTPPPWAEGFPIGVEGFTAKRYSKSAFRDSFHVKRG